MVKAYPRKHKNVLTVFWPTPQIGWLNIYGDTSKEDQIPNTIQIRYDIDMSI